MFKNYSKILILTFFVLSLFLMDCTNIGFDGPNVISQEDAYSGFNKILLVKLLSMNETDEFIIALIADTGNDSDDLSNCERSIYYFQNSVDSCEQILWTISGNNSEELLLNFYLTIDNICNLKSVDFINSKKPFQGEYRTCKYLLLKEY